MLARPAPGRALSGIIAAASALWLLACGPINGAPSATAEEGAKRFVYVASNGWHTGIVVPRDALAPGMVPEAGDFPGAGFLEFGWGDRDYYPNPRPSLGAALAAALTPTESVIHLAALTAPPRAGGNTEVVALPVTEPGLRRMIAEIDAAFDRGDRPRAEALAPGLSHRSSFYPAHGSFHLLNTCNTWVARKLEAAGVGISPGGVITAGDLMDRLGEVASGDRAEP